MLRKVLKALQPVLLKVAQNIQEIRQVSFNLVLLISATASIFVVFIDKENLFKPQLAQLIKLIMPTWFLIHLPFYFLSRTKIVNIVRNSYFYSAIFILFFAHQCTNFSGFEKVILQIPQVYSILFVAILILPFKSFSLFSTATSFALLFLIILSHKSFAQSIGFTGFAIHLTNVVGQWLLSIIISGVFHIHYKDLLESRSKLANHNERLEEEVNAKVKMIQRQQDQLHQSQKLKSLGQLAGGIAHDFKNQLFGISASAYLIKKVAGNNPRVLKNVENILTSSQRSADISNQLLAFARKGKIKSVGIDIHSVLSRQASLFNRTIDKKIRVKMELSAEKHVISGDPGQIDNALLNLAINARDAMPNGGMLTLATTNSTLQKEFCSKSEYDITAGDYVQISVSDTGEGIEDSIKNNIFEPFFTQKEKGIGLGLSAVYGTITEHKGAIAIDTKVGSGTTITIYLPVSLSTIPKKEKVKVVKKIETTKTILIIEDEDIVRISTQKILVNLGFHIKAFPEGKSALDYYRKSFNKVDLILLDMILPDYGVKELFSELQSINPSAKIILWSAFTFPNEIKALREKGAIDFIDKGIGTNEFTQRILSIVKKYFDEYSENTNQNLS